MSRYLPPILLIALLAVTSLVGWQGSGGGDPRLIKIVSSLPRTGSAKAANGYDRQRHQDRAGRGGLARRRIRNQLRGWDDATAGAGQWTAEAENGQCGPRGARSGRDGLYRHLQFRAAKISMPVLNKAHLLMISPANTWPGLTKPDKGDPGEPDIYRPTGEVNYVRMVPTDDLQGPLGTAWAKELGVNASTCSTTTKFTARESPRCSSRRARIWASKCWGTKALTRRPRNLKV